MFWSETIWWTRWTTFVQSLISAQIPEGFFIVPLCSAVKQLDEDCLVILKLDVSADFPRILCSIKVHSKMDFSVYHRDKQLKHSKFSKVMQYPQLLKTFSDLLNLMAFLSNTIDLFNPINASIGSILSYLDECDLCDETKSSITFLHN